MNIEGSVNPEVMGNTCSAIRQRMPWIQDQVSQMFYVLGLYELKIYINNSNWVSRLC